MINTHDPIQMLILCLSILAVIIVAFLAGARYGFNGDRTTATIITVSLIAGCILGIVQSLVIIAFHFHYQP